ncbi:SAM-dependent methyltransferase [Pseudonocardia sp. H11422]|uniref:SAM-dependent methyltransferase n=1 Tax=Pseudonocardia sp. H11422 TaxID=2835866 RepID=UPI001BDD8704|nr:SAM-dependent methyltransferase [Pseudonocardia sp. H11422]
MAGDGPVLFPRRRGGPALARCRRGSRTRAGTLIGLGVGPGEPDALAPGAVDRLAGADVVFVPAAAEATVLFYAEAWRVERIGDRDGARHVADWFAAHPGGTAVFATAGDPGICRSFGAAAGVARELIGALRVSHLPGVTIVPPRRSPLPWTTP